MKLFVTSGFYVKIGDFKRKFVSILCFVSRLTDQARYSKKRPSFLEEEDWKFLGKGENYFSVGPHKTVQGTVFFYSSRVTGFLANYYILIINNNLFIAHKVH